MLMFGKYIFLGNQIGIIRVLDVTRQAEVRPLVDESTRIKTHSLFATEAGTYLISGHDNGTVVLWDLHKYTMAIKMEGVHSTGA